MQERFGCKPSALHAGVGPSAGPERYEVQDDVFQAAANLYAPVEMGGSIYNSHVVYLKRFIENGVKVTALKPAEKKRIKETAQKAALKFVKEKVGAELVEKTMKTVDDIEKRLYSY